jgi:signal transduction histidine kinase
MEQPWAGPAEPEPAVDQRRVILVGLDPVDRRTVDALLASALGATGSRRVERPSVDQALEELRRSREAGALPAILAGSQVTERDLLRLARTLGNREGPVPIVVLLPAPVEGLAEAAFSQGCCDVLVRGLASADDLVRALRCAFEIARREKAEERLRRRSSEPGAAPAALVEEARQFVGLGRLLAATSHDLNNLLQPILGYADLLGGSVEPDTRAGHYVRQIDRSAQVASSLVRRMLACGRRSQAPATPVDADRTLAELEDLVRWVVGSGVDLFVRQGASGAQIELAEGVLEQVVLNLATNARDAMGSTGRLELRTAVEPDRYWRLEVEDSGPGIPSERMERLFEPGFSTKPSHRGAGLGLWIVRGLIEDAGGQVAVRSAEGRGTMVTVRIPLCEPPARTAHPGP